MRFVAPSFLFALTTVQAGTDYCQNISQNVHYQQLHHLVQEHGASSVQQVAHRYYRELSPEARPTDTNDLFLQNLARYEKASLGAKGSADGPRLHKRDDDDP
ncbi:hypothetical protein BJ085DRAFT_34593, partial [Dimargaris cristalligena]